MNVSMHQVRLANAQAFESSEGISGFADFEEQGGRTGTLSMYFGSAEDCQAAADKLAELAEQMRDQQEALGEQSLSRNQPCGCVICVCEDDEQCQGCGAKSCGKHPADEIPNPVYENSEADHA